MGRGRGLGGATVVTDAGGTTTTAEATGRASREDTGRRYPLRSTPVRGRGQQQQPRRNQQS